MVQANKAHQQTLMQLNRLAHQSLSHWNIPSDASVRLINVSENVTFLVEAQDYKSILRIHREGYHSRQAIECELAWAESLDRETEIVTPRVYPGIDGRLIQSGSVKGLNKSRFMVLFHFIEGKHPDETQDLTGNFENLGRMAARMHIHSISWQRPGNFERLVWNDETVFGSIPTWGDWRAGPNLTNDSISILEKLEATIRKRLAAFGRNNNNYGLIHADMRLANLIIHGDELRLIDFDDCGLGWFLYDFAAAISFIEDDPAVPALKKCWIKGYRDIRELSLEEEQEIDTFVMLRRMSLLAWIGSHIEAPEPQALAPDFAQNTAKLAYEYLQRMR